ncbi:MAG: sigma-70 family RNA polymerase sigma factor [Rhizobacter sp.]|nr:sigma-70 family RNA polymerase sigma factor [Chlorobiales bacterium]
MIIDKKTGDGDLLRLIAGRSQDAFEIFYQRYAAYVYSAVLKIIGSQPDAEELVQDIFVYVWNKADLYDGTRGGGSTWLFTIARSRAIDFIRSKRSRHMQAEVHGDDSEFEETNDAAESSALTQVIQGEEHERIVRALMQLPEEQKTAIEMAFFSGLSHTEISEALKSPLGTVKTRIRQGMMKLSFLLRAEAEGKI